MMRKKTKTKSKVKKLNKELFFTYKKAGELRRYTNDQGMIISRFETGLSQKQQRSLTTAIKRARLLALMPFTQTL
ncbi:MAG: 30S ribosomal protein S18 [Patescibacteria group bacterium]